MPIEIRELHIKAVVEDRPASDNFTAGQSDATSGEAFDMEALIALCVEKVLEILKEKEER